MSDKQVIIIHEQQTFTVGTETFVDSMPGSEYAVIFEDNTETGYFYAARNSEALEILDALHIYNVSDVLDRDKPSKLKILWNEDLSIAVLSINDYYHAAFNFRIQGGFCRNGFPQGNEKWTRIAERILTEELMRSW